MNHPLLDHPILSGRYFYPWPNHFDTPFFVEGDGFRLGCHYSITDPQAPTIIHFHGNGETVADYLDGFSRRINDLGANLLLSEYRGYGMSTGEPALAAMLDDVGLVVAASGVAPEKIIFFGRSLGSLYAAHGAALYPEAAGLIIESGLADPLERVLVRVEPRQIGATMDELRKAVADYLDQRRKVQAFKGQVLIMHTRNDDIIPASHGRQLYDWAKEPKKLLVFERGDHNNILAVNEEAYFAAVGACVQAIRDEAARHGTPG